MPAQTQSKADHAAAPQAAQAPDIKRYLHNLDAERNAALLYTRLAENETNASLVSAAASAVGLFAIGAAITLMTGRSVWYSGMRQVLFGMAAAAVTFGVGRLIGVNVAG